MRFETVAVALLHAGWAKAQLAYADNQLPLQQDDDIVSDLFPDVEEFELFSPAFTDPGSVPSEFAEGTSGPTDLDVLVDFLRDVADDNDWASFHDTLKSEEGRSIPYVYLSSSQGDFQGGNGTEKLRIWLQGGVHGNEPGGDQALLSLLGKFDSNTTWAESVLDKADIVILPRYNPDGVAYLQRQLASNYDPNRDQANLKVKQSRDVKRVLSNFNPHIFLDAHEYTGGQRLGGDGQYRKAQDAQLSHVKNPNVHREIRQLGEGLFTSSVEAALGPLGLRTSPYFTASGGTDDLVLTEPSSVSRPNHNNAGLLQAIAFLSETRGIRQGDQHFQRRTASGHVVAEAIVQTAVDNADEVYSIIENARQSFTESTDDIVITDSANVQNTTWEFIDARDGTVVQLPVTFNNNTPSVPELTRERPEAYVFSAAFAEAAEKLRVSGVEVEVLEEDFVGTVEVLRVTSAEVASTKYEGIAETTVETESFSKEVRIPAGGFRVSTRQKNAAFALVTLEPENRSSYVTYNIIPLNNGDEYPVFRVL